MGVHVPLGVFRLAHGRPPATGLEEANRSSSTRVCGPRRAKCLLLVPDQTWEGWLLDHTAVQSPAMTRPDRSARQVPTIGFAIVGL